MDPALQLTITTDVVANNYMARTSSLSTFHLVLNLFILVQLLHLFLSDMITVSLYPLLCDA